MSRATVSNSGQQPTTSLVIWYFICPGSSEIFSSRRAEKNNNPSFCTEIHRVDDSPGSASGCERGHKMDTKKFSMPPRMAKTDGPSLPNLRPSTPRRFCPTWWHTGSRPLAQLEVFHVRRRESRPSLNGQPESGPFVLQPANLGSHLHQVLVPRDASQAGHGQIGE